MVKSLEVSFCDDGCGFWRLINAVWPDMWCKQYFDDEDPLQQFMRALNEWHEEKSDAQWWSLRDQAEHLWSGREFDVPIYDAWLGNSIETCSLGDVQRCDDGIRFIFDDCGGNLELVLKSRSYWDAGKSIVPYTIRWITRCTRSDHVSGTASDIAYHLYARNIVMAYLLSGADGYLTFVTGTKSVTTKKISHALRTYFLE